MVALLLMAQSTIIDERKQINSEKKSIFAHNIERLPLLLTLKRGHSYCRG